MKTKDPIPSISYGLTIVLLLVALAGFLDWTARLQASRVECDARAMRRISSVSVIVPADVQMAGIQKR